MPKIITGYTSTPHVTSDDAAAFQQGIVGYDDYALASENQLTAVTVESSRLRLSKAEIVIQGVHVRLDGTEEVTCAAQTVGTTRLDRIALRYTKDASTNVESVELAVIQGQEAASNAVAPDLVQDDLRNGGLTREVSLFLVTLKDSVITSVTREIPVLYNMNELKDYANKHTSQISAAENKLTQQASSINQNSTEIKTLQGKHDFADQVRSVSKYAKAQIISWVSSWKQSNAQPDILGAQLGVQDAAGTTKASLRIYSNGWIKFFKGNSGHDIPIIKRGTATLNVKKANETVSKEVSYGCTFSKPPTIILTPHTGAPQNVSLGTGNVGTDKFRINLNRSSVVETSVDWVAIGIL